jgi:hypothetical protein
LRDKGLIPRLDNIKDGEGNFSPDLVWKNKSQAIENALRDPKNCQPLNDSRAGSLFRFSTQ